MSLKVTGFVHHVVAGFVAKGKLMEMRLNTSFLAYNVNINVCQLHPIFTFILFPFLNIFQVYLCAYVNVVLVFVKLV